MPKNILFRSDSSSSIGVGHVMRDLVLASQFENAKIFFASQDLEGNINYKIEEQNFELKVLQSNDIEEVVSLIKEYEIDMIVIDSYSIDYNYEKALKEKVNVEIFSLDDTYEKHYCDILLNHNIYADKKKYKNLVPPTCELRCGSEYMLLRDEFILAKQKNEAKTLQKEKNVLVAMGGSDHSNINIEILRVLENFPELYVDIITTSANKYLAALREYSAKNTKVVLHVDTNKVADLMSEAEFAIVTPSVTLNEIFYMQVPFIAIKTAENQKYMYDYLSKHNYFALEKFDAIELNNTISVLINFLNVQLHNFIDLSMEKKKMVLKWRNDASVKKWMFNQNEILLEEHLKYIDSLKLKKDRLYFLVRKDDCDIGVIDFTSINKERKSAEFGIYAKPELKGFGKLLMEIIIDYAFRILQVNKLISKVFEENHIGIQLYSKYGFRIVDIKKIDGRNILCMELHR